MDINEKLKGGVIMDVINAEQARIAEAAGAVSVMALERVPADIRAAGGVSRMSDPKMIEEIMKAVKIPVMANIISTNQNLTLLLFVEREIYRKLYEESKKALR